METKEKVDVYQIVTNRIIELLEKGTVPWNQPWASDSRLPMNLVSGKQYRGINVFLLHVSGYGSPYWVSYKQAQERGGQVRVGEKSSLAVFWKLYETIDRESGEKKNVPVLRYYRVFNVEQCDGLDYPKPEPRSAEFNAIEECEAIIKGMPNGPRITHNDSRAYYVRSEDRVNLPKKETFLKAEEYYSTAFHELAHSTGHESRIGRFQKDKHDLFGSGPYAKEELVAEMSASFLCAVASIENSTIDNSASYIAGWLQRLKNDKKLVVHAAAAASKASDYILGKGKGNE